MEYCNIQVFSLLDHKSNCFQQKYRYSKLTERKTLNKADNADLVTYSRNLLPELQKNIGLQQDTIERIKTLIAPPSENVDPPYSRTLLTQADLSKVQADLSEVHADLSEVKADLSEVQADLSEVQADLSEVHADLQYTRSRLTYPKSRLTYVTYPRSRLTYTRPRLTYQRSRLTLSEVQADLPCTILTHCENVELPCMGKPARKLLLHE